MGLDAKIKPLPPLTSLRFFAAAAIVIMHSAGKWGMPPLSSIHFAVGVDLFFILSGFILAYNYRSMPSMADAIRVIGYRIARIWPLHLVTLAAAMLLFADSRNPYFDPTRLWATIPMIHAWLGNGIYALHGNAVSWTISVEFGPGIIFVAPSRSRKCSSLSHARRVTASSRSMAICAAGPPNAVKPSRSASSATSATVPWGRAGAWEDSIGFSWFLRVIRFPLTPLSPPLPGEGIGVGYS